MISIFIRSFIQAFFYCLDGLENFVHGFIDGWETSPQKFIRMMSFLLLIFLGGLICGLCFLGTLIYLFFGPTNTFLNIPIYTVTLATMTMLFMINCGILMQADSNC